MEIEEPTVFDLEKLVIDRNEKLLKQYVIRQPPPKLMSGMSARFQKLADATTNNESVEVKLLLLYEMYEFMREYLDDGAPN